MRDLETDPITKAEIQATLYRLGSKAQTPEDSFLCGYISRIIDEHFTPKEERPASYRHSRVFGNEGAHLYYFTVLDRRPPPYRHQREVNAIIDIAADGTLAGVELIEHMPPPP